MPAAAVIPAPIAYVKVVAAKKLVVGFLLRTSGPLYERASSLASASVLKTFLRLTAWYGPDALNRNPTTSFFTATTLIYAIGAGITAAAGTRLALQWIVVK